MNPDEIRETITRARGTIGLAADLHEDGIHDPTLLSLALADLEKAEGGLKSLRPRFAGGLKASQGTSPFTTPAPAPDVSESLTGACEPHAEIRQA